MRQIFHAAVMLVGLLLARDALAQHPCDVVQPPTMAVIAGRPSTVTACWTGLDTATPPAVVTNASWRIVVDGDRTDLAMAKSGVSSATGEFLYTGTATFTVGVHQVTVEVVDVAGNATAALPARTVTATASPNLPPVVSAGPDISGQAGTAITLAGVITDDGLPLAVSPDGLRVPAAAEIIDNVFNRWALGSSVGAYRVVLFNGSQLDGDAVGSQILWRTGVVYVKGDDENWYGWTAGVYSGGVGATDPGVPTVPAVPPHVTQTWTQVSGPGSSVVTFSDATKLAPTMTAPVEGTYVLRLTGSDGSVTAFDELTAVIAPGQVLTSLVVVKNTATCKITVSAPAPTTQTGWKFQALYGVTAATTSLDGSDATAPYLGTKTLAVGSYVVSVRWTRTGSATITMPAQALTCP